MKLNSLGPQEGSRHAGRRVGRGTGSGHGKTAGRGHKGQKSRSGRSIKPGFEGGQMPLQMRLPKFGFRSRKARVTAEVRLGELARLAGDEVSMESLKVAGIIRRNAKRARVILSGEVRRAFTLLDDVRATAGARAAIEKAGGRVVAAAATAERKAPAAEASSASTDGED